MAENGESGGGGRRPLGVRPAELACGLLLLAAAALAVLWPGGFNREEAKSALRIAGYEPSTVAAATPQAKVKGSTTVPAEVTILVNNVPFGKVGTGEHNSFAFDNLPLRLGPNRIQALANTTVPGPTVWGRPTKLYLRASSGVNKIAGAVSTPTPAPAAYGARRVTAHLSYRRLRLDVEVSLPSDDRRAQDLAEERITVQQFVRRTLGDFSVNYRPAYLMFGGVRRSRIVADGGLTTITASSKTEDFVPGEEGLIDFTPYWRPTENAADSFTLRVSDYTVEHLNPPPSVWTQDWAAWSGSRAELIPTQEQMEKNEERDRVVRAKVSRDALDDPSIIFRQLRLSPYDVFPSDLRILVAFALSFLAAIPSLWVLAVLSRPHGGGWGGGDGSRPYKWLQRLARYLAALTFVPPALFAAFQITTKLPDGLKDALGRFYGSRGVPGTPQDDDLRSLLLSVVLVWLAALALRLLAAFVMRWLARRRAGRGVGFWLWAAFRSVGDAAALAVALNVVLAAVLWVLPANLLGLGEWATAALNLLGVAPALALAGAAAYAHWDVAGLPSNRGLRALLIAAAAAALWLGFAALAFPDARTELSGKVSTYVLISTRNFFSLLRDLTPYATLMGVALLLAREDGRGDGGAYARAAAGKAIFVAYVVGSSPNLFLVPVPLLLALWLFDKHVMHDEPGQRRLDALKPKVVGVKNLLGDVLAVPTMKDYEGVVERCREELANKEITLADFDRKIKEIRDYVSGQKVEVEAGGETRDAKGVVLGLGVHPQNWKNGRWALARGLLLAVPFAVVFAWELLQVEAGRAASNYRALRVVGPALVLVAYWGVSAYFFGYFAAYIRGRTGLKKGGRVAAVAVACLLPIWAASLGSPLGLMLRVAQTVLFFTALGAWMDYRIFRASLGEGFSWKKLVQFEEVPALTTAGSALLASVGALVTSSLTDQLGGLTTQLVSMAFRQSPAIIPGP